MAADVDQLPRRRRRRQIPARGQPLVGRPERRRGAARADTPASARLVQRPMIGTIARYTNYSAIDSRLE